MMRSGKQWKTILSVCHWRYYASCCA